MNDNLMVYRRNKETLMEAIYAVYVHWIDKI